MADERGSLSREWMVDITNLQQSTEPKGKSLKLLKGKESDAQGKGKRRERRKRGVELSRPPPESLWGHHPLRKA